MTTETVTVVARIRAKAGREEEVRGVLLHLVELTRAEQGCINYDLHQSPDDRGQFLIYENWANRAAFDAHMATPHLQDFLGRAPELLAEPAEVSLWQMLQGGT